MGVVMGGLLPLAAGVAITPLPVSLVILILLTADRTATAAWFMVGWAVGIVAALGVFLAVAYTAGLSNTRPSRLGAAIEIVIGLGSLLLALRAWRARPAPGEPIRRPRWVTILAGLSPIRSAGLGFVLAAFGPKNIALNVAAAVVVTGGALAMAGTTVAVVVYAVLSASTVVAPVLAYAVAGERARPTLDRLRGWLARHSAAVTAVLLLVFGFVVIGQGVWAVSWPSWGP